jgi:hypothetical protein
VKTALTVFAIGVTCLALTASALAGGSLLSSYGGQGTTPQVKVSTAAQNSAAAKPAAAKPAATKPSGGTLPFTGMDVGFVLAAGAVLLGAGLALRRGARKT